MHLVLKKRAYLTSGDIMKTAEQTVRPVNLLDSVVYFTSVFAAFKLLNVSH